MPTAPRPQGEIPGQLIDELCDEFEQGWLSGTPVPLESVVQSAPEPVRVELFRELLAIEGEYRAKTPRPITPAEARDRFAGLGDWADTVIREVFAETGSWHGPPPPAAPSGPQKSYIGKYELIAKLGSGAHGVVFKALHPELRRFCAVKVLYPPQNLTPDDRRRFHQLTTRFRRERVALARLSHPNIIQATDGGEAGGALFLVMEFVDGTDLARVLKAARRLAVPDACEAVRQAAEGLAYIQRNRMVHRDVKPSNLLLGRDGVVRVLDLGLARVTDPGPGEGVTETGALMGTPDFIAPEQASGGPDIDIRADVYSLGCTLYALLSGAPPFSGPEFDNAYKKFRAHNEAPVPPLSASCPDLPAGLEDLVLRMLRKPPAERPDSPATVAREIAPFCAGHDLPRLVPSTAETPLHPTTQTGVENVPGLDTVLRPDPHGTTFTREAKRGRRAAWVVAAAALAVITGVAAWFATRPGGGGPPPTPPDQNPPPREFRPGEWTELLDREPTVLAWPDRPGPSKWGLEPAPETGGNVLRVECTDLGMLQLAVVDLPRFDLEITFSQTTWVGGVGFFVRGRKEEERDRSFLDADLVVIERFDRKENVQELTARRSRVRTYPNLRAVIDGGRVGRAPLQWGIRHRFVVSVGERGVEGLAVDDRLVNPPLSELLLAEQPRAGARGAIGVLVSNCSAVFESVRVRPVPNP